MMCIPLCRTAYLFPAVLLLAWCPWCPAAINTNGQRDDEQTSIIYDAGTGEVSVDTPFSTELASIVIDSAGGIFSGPAQNMNGPFDTLSADRLRKAVFLGTFGSLSFGLIAPPDLSEAFVASDFTVIGTLADGGDLGEVDLIYIPAPPPRIPACGTGVALPLLAMGLLRIIKTRPR